MLYIWVVFSSHVLLKIFDDTEHLTTHLTFGFARSQDEEARTARVIRKCSALFNSFIVGLEVISKTILVRIFLQNAENVEKLKCNQMKLLGDDQLKEHWDFLERLQPDRDGG